MKYYHLIYNSSQRTQDGTIGLGVRSYTDGMPKEYIDALKENGFFNYTSGNMQQPSPKMLIEDGKSILKLPVSYNYAKIYVPSTGKEIFVISRTVSVGFDYPYYVKFVAARLDNFVLDAYIFEECPTLEYMQVFYENPKDGNVGFSPRNRVPSPENEEMKSLSLGQMPLFAQEDKSFACDKLMSISKTAVELLFAYIEAERIQKPLLVKCSNSIATTLMIDLMRILPQRLQKEAFFFVNYQLEGFKEGYKVFFVDDSYKYDYESSGQFYVFDLTKNHNVSTKDSETYREEIIKLIVENDNDELSKRIEWILNPVYLTIRDKSDEVKRVFYNYVVEPSLFDINDLHKCNENELWTPLKEYFSKGRENQKLFNNKISFYLKNDGVIGDSLIAMLKLTNRLIDFGFELDDVVRNAQKDVSVKLLESPEYFKIVLDKLGVEPLRKYFDKTVFEKHEGYLDNKLFALDWAKIYKLFYPVSKQEDYEAIIIRMLGNNIPQAIYSNVIDEFRLDNLALCSCYTKITKENLSLIDRTWKLINELLSKMQRNGERLPDERLAKEIYSYVIKPLRNDNKCTNDVAEANNLMALLTGSFNSDNFDVLFRLAVKVGTKQTVELLYNKGFDYVDNKSVDRFIKEIMDKLKPNKTELLRRIGSHPCKVEMLVSFLRLTNETAKNVDKMRKDGLLKVSDEEFDELMLKLFNMRKKTEAELKEERKIKIIRIASIAAGAVIVVGIVLFCVLRKPAKKENAKPHKNVEATISDTVQRNDSVIQKQDTININIEQNENTDGDKPQDSTSKH